MSLLPSTVLLVVDKYGDRCAIVLGSGDLAHKSMLLVCAWYCSTGPLLPCLTCDSDARLPAARSVEVVWNGASAVGTEDSAVEALLQTCSGPKEPFPWTTMVELGGVRRGAWHQILLLAVDWFCQS